MRAQDNRIDSKDYEAAMGKEFEPSKEDKENLMSNGQSEDSMQQINGEVVENGNILSHLLQWTVRN